MTSLSLHPRGVQRKWRSEDALQPSAPSSVGEQALPTPGGREAPRNACGIPFSTLRCCVPEPSRGGGPPGTPERGPRTRGPPPSGSPGPGSGGAVSPASRTAPARRAGARSASGGTAPPRPPSCPDATRPRPLAPSSRSPGPSPGQWGRRGGAGGREPERDKELREESGGRDSLGRTRCADRARARRPHASVGPWGAPRPLRRHRAAHPSVRG